MNKRFFNQQNLTRRLRLLPVLFAMLLMPLSAWAEDYNVVIGTTQITDANMNDVLGDGGSVKYVPLSPAYTGGTLKLTNANINGKVRTNYANLTIELVGKNTIAVNDTSALATWFDAASLTFTTSATSPGSLTLTPGEYYPAIGGTGKNFQITYENGLSLNPATPTTGQTAVVGVSCGLTVGEVPVTTANASNITGTGITGTVSYDAENHKLTLNGATINGVITYSGTEDLTIAFSGTNSVSTSENYAIQYVGSDSELPNLAFSLTNGSTTGSLNLSSENCVINGFSDVDFGNLNLASASAQGVYYDSSEYGYHMAGYGGNPNNLTITTETYHPIWIYDPSLGQEASHTQLNSNKLSVAFGEGTISFDGNHTITMNNVDFNYEDNTLIVVGPGMEELTVNLVGTSTVRSGSIFLSLWATTPLTFTTDESNPGSLTAPTIVSWNNIENGQITYQNGLVFNFDESTYKGTISTTGDRLKIGDISINATGDITGDGITGTVHFDTSNNTLTLTGATLGDVTAENNIQVFVDNLKVSINGSNTIFGNIIYEGNNLQSSAVQINKASDASTASLTASGISGFANCSWSEGIYLSAVNGAGIPTDIHYESYENEGGSMVSYSGDFSTITFSTTKPSESIWIGETQVGTNGTFSGIGGVSFDSDKNILTLDNADLQSQGNIISSLPNLTIKLTGEDGERYGRSDLGENKYIISTDPSATLTFTTDGNNSLCSTIDNYDFPWKGFAGNPTFENKLVLLQAAGTMSIEVLQAPTMSYASGNLSFDGLSDGYGNEFDCYYSITYADGDGNIETTKYEPGDGDQPNPVSMVEKPCTVTAYVTYKDRLGNTTQSETAIGKYFGPAEDPMRLVYGADPVDLVLAPTIEESDGIKINGIEANVTYNATTGKVSSETLGSHGAVVSLGYQDETIQTTLLNNYFNMSFDVVPPAPTIGLAEGDYPSTQENITITSDGLANTTIKYQWDEGEIKDYPATGGVPFQAGTLKAWVVYTSGETSLSSDIVSATYNILPEAGLQYVLGNDPVEEAVDYVMGGTGSEVTLPTLLNPNNVSVTYASGNTAIATVAEDGTVTPVGVGSTTITAKSTATTEYAASEASYWLNVYKSLSHSSITVEISAVTYNGQAQTPTVIVKDGDDVLPYGEDDGLIYAYKVEFANNTNAALATAETNAPTATITALTDGSVSHLEVNWYRGSTTKTFTINKAQLTVKADDKTYNVGDDIELTVSYDGFVNGETKTVLTTQPTASYGTADVTKPGSYEITASGGEAANYDFVYQPGTLTINRQLNVSFSTSNEWATYYGSENLAKPEGLKAYQVTAVDGSTVTIEEIGYIPANTAVLLKNVSNNNTWSNIAASAYEGETTTFPDNILQGGVAVDVSTITGGTVYVLYNNMFKRATGGTIPANRGYLVVEPSAVNAGNAPQLSITIGDETTSIDNGQLTIDNYAGEWYSIDGVKLNGQPQKPGLYIKNGKKVFINKK